MATGGSGSSRRLGTGARRAIRLPSPPVSATADPGRQFPRRWPEMPAGRVRETGKRVRRSGRRVAGALGPAQAVLADPLVERGARDAEQVGGALHRPALLLEHAGDVLALDLVQGDRGAGGAFGRAPGP